MAVAQLIFDEETLKRLKKLIQEDDKSFDQKHEYYKASVDHYETMSWHVYGTKPDKLLQRNRPHEDPAIRAYRLESYEPITKSTCKKGLNIVHKIFNPKLFSIRFKDTTEAKRLEKYSLQDYPRFNSVVNYLSGYVLKKMIADPNGILLVQPLKYQLKGSEYINPIATCYNSKSIHWWVPEEYILLFDGCREYGKTKEWRYTYCDRNAIYKLLIEQVNGKNMTVTTTDSYIHNFNEIPIWQLQGEYSEEQYGLLESFFFAAVPFWNKAINDESDSDGNYRLQVNASKWEISDECEYVDHLDEGHFACDGGYIFNQIKGEKFKCPSCGGSGRKKTANSPYEVYQVNKEKTFPGEDGVSIPLPPFGWEAPPVEGVKLLEQRAQRNLEMGLNALSMDIVDKIGENQSGIAKEIDRTELNDFLEKISGVCFDIHLTNIYYYFTKFMFGVASPEKIEEIQPEISKPTEFNVYSTLELTEQFSKAKEADLNPSYLQTLQKEIQNKKFQTNPELLHLLNLMLDLDPLAEVSRDDVSLMIANKTVTQETAIIHDNIKMFVLRALSEDKKFAEAEPEKQMEVLRKYAEEVVEATKVTIDMSALENPLNQNQNNPPDEA